MDSKSAKPTERKLPKYQDKSAGQPEMQQIFESLRKILQPFAGGSIQSRTAAGQYHLWSEKDMRVNGRKMNELLFASAMVQKGYVGFYFFPIYCYPDLKKTLPPGLLALLKGKNCFHIRKWDEELLSKIEVTLQAGHLLYLRQGWAAR
jgi:hypothetical protein